MDAWVWILAGAALIIVVGAVWLATRETTPAPENADEIPPDQPIAGAREVVPDVRAAEFAGLAQDTPLPGAQGPEEDADGRREGSFSPAPQRGEGTGA